MSIVNGITFFLTLVASVFFLIGCIGFSDDEATIKKINWFHYDSNDDPVSFGLKYFTYDINVGIFTKKGTMTYSSDACTGDFCGDCDRDGQAAFGLLIVALISSTSCLLLSGASMASPSAPMDMANSFVALFACLLSLICVCVFMGDCYSQIALDAPDYVYWGPGSILTLLGMFLMLIVTTMKISASFCGCCGAVKGGEQGLKSNIEM